MQDLKIGVVGMGPRGRGWLGTFGAVKGARVAAVCDKYAALVEQGLRTLDDPAARGYTAFDRMMAEAAVDAVAVVVEPENQPPLIQEALRAGKHVLCEVPLTYDLQACRDIVSAVEKSGLIFGMAEQISFSPMTLAWRKLREDGRLGRVVFAEGQYLHGMGEDRLWRDARTGERVARSEARRRKDVVKSRLWKLTHPIWYLPHDLGPLLRILDDRVRSVTCLGTRRPSYHYEEAPLPDVEVALMHTEKDTIIRQACGFCMPTPQPHHWYHLVGTRGEVETSRTGRDLFTEPGQWWFSDGYMATRESVRWDFTPYQTGSAAAAATGHGGLDFYPLQDFVDAVRQGRPPAVDVYRAADISAAGICAGLSAERGGQPVEVPDVRCAPRRKPAARGGRAAERAPS